MSDVIVLPRNVIEKIRERAKDSGLTLEEYIIELVLKDFDPIVRAREYVKAAENLLEQATEELKKNNVRQSAEKIWGATALIVKAYALWKEGKRLASHRELWEYVDILVDELGEWVRDSWMYANGMHICFYEGWCTKRQVEVAVERVKKLLKEIENKMK